MLDTRRIHDDVLGDAGSRMHDANLFKVLLEPRDQAPDPSGHGRERLAACRIGFAGSERLVQSRLRVASREKRKAHVGWRDAIEHHGSHVRPVLTDVDQRRARTVRPSIQIDAVVAQELAHIVQVIHGDACRIEAYIGVISGKTPTQSLERRLAPLGELLQRAGVGTAIQRVGFSRPALVDENDVPRALDIPEEHAYLARQLGRGLSGAAGEEEEGILAGRRRERRQYDNPEMDLPSNSGMTVLEDSDGATERIGQTFTARAGVQAIERAVGPGHAASGRD
jgi:hypothetical protein